MKIDKKSAYLLAQLFHLNLCVVSFDEWLFGLNVELEHGVKEPLTDVTNNDLIKTAKITLVHLMEYPDYYRRLKKMEKEAEEYWKNIPKNIFIKKDKTLITNKFIED